MKYHFTPVRAARIKKANKDKILPFAIIWMGMEGIMLSEISPTEKDKYHMTSLKWNMKN